MAMNINKVIIVGKLLKDPNISTTTNNKSVANIVVVTDESYFNDNKLVSKFEQHKIVAWGKQADFCKQLKKNDTVYIEGKNQTRKRIEDDVISYVSEIVAKDIQKG